VGLAHTIARSLQNSFQSKSHFHGGKEMSKQLPQRSVPLLTGNNSSKPRKPSMPLAGVLILSLLGGLLCAILGIGVAFLFPTEIRAALGFPVPTNAIISQQPGNEIDIASTMQALALTQTAIANNVGGDQQPPASSGSTPYPTYTPMPTYTPFSLPSIEAPTNTPEPGNLLFSDTFDNEINPAYWQQFGKWMISNGVPIVVEAYYSDSVSVLNGMGSLLFPGTAQLDNIAIEFDLVSYQDLYILFSYKDGLNYKRIRICTSCSRRTMGEFYFHTNETSIAIPQSEVSMAGEKVPTHIRIEIRGNSLVLYVNERLKYNFKDLPDSMTGTIGFAVSSRDPAIDDFKIYQLP
jgi:hypothetical protein